MNFLAISEKPSRPLDRRGVLLCYTRLRKREKISRFLDLKLQGPTCVVLSFDLLWNHTQMLPPMIDILVIVPPFTVICFENSLNYCVKFPHSPMPILHYAFSSWIEKTMTKTIHCHWENRFVLL